MDGARCVEIINEGVEKGLSEDQILAQIDSEYIFSQLKKQQEVGK